MHAFKKKMMKQKSDDRVSVVMISRDRGSQIRVALEHLLRLPERPRVIVVDNASSDKTPDMARSMGARVEVISLGQNLGGAGRNIGVLKTETPYVAFSNDHSWWAPGALQRAADLFDSHPELGLIAAKILIGPDQELDPLCTAMAKAGFSNLDKRYPVGIPIVGFAACGAIVRRSAFLEAGGFEQMLGVGGEEHILALDLLRNGWQLTYVDEIVAYHHPSPIRDLNGHKRLEVRNIFWSAWLRRPVASAFAKTWRLLRLCFKDKAYRDGLLEAMSELQWIISARDPVPAAIDRQVQIAEAVFHNSVSSL